VSDADLLSVLPEVFQVAATPDGPMAALAAAASDMHAPIRDVLDGIDRVVDPFRCPDSLVAYLAWWVDLGWLTLPLGVILYLFEAVLIAGLQAFIFAILTAIYIGGASAASH